MSGNLRTQQNSLEEAGLTLLFMVILIGGFTVFAWMKAHGAISEGVLTLLRGELWLASLWTHDVDQARHAMADAVPGTVKLGQLVRACAFVGRVYRIPTALLLGGLGGIAIWRAPGERFSEVMDFERLMAIQAVNFPSIAAFVKRRHGLILPGHDRVRQADFALHLGEWIGANARDSAGHYDQIAAHGALVTQLGEPWRDLDHALPQIRAMFAVFALHLGREREAARDLLGTLSQSLAAVSLEEGAADPATNPGPAQPLTFTTEATDAVNGVLHRTEIVEPALGVMRFYAFSTTAMMGLLMQARAKAGVLAPGQFAFLKLVDRPLWYALHSLGFPLTENNYGPQPNARIEALGARAHWEAERAVGQPLPRPRVEAALAAIKLRILDESNRGRALTEIR
ncbi:MAG: hypothetical protein PHT60_15040 [Acidiphilium sp.]|nr:hypothetical protein [Acidiphilium sp.]MDD4937078.1 hypothetical protein [Acidiphilium sp.]